MRIVTGYIEVFLRFDSPSFGEMDLMLTAPQRGHTCSLTWFVADGDLVPSDRPLFRQQSDADPGDERGFVSPLPARVQILQAAGHFLPPGPIGRLHYGYALEDSFRKEWQALALDLDAELRERQPTLMVPESDIFPGDLVKLVFLDFTLARALEKAGLGEPPPVIPVDLRGDRAVATLEQLYRWKTASVRAAAQFFPDEVTEQTLLLWEHVFANLTATLRHDGLTPKDGLTSDRD